MANVCFPDSKRKWRQRYIFNRSSKALTALACLYFLVLGNKRGPGHEHSRLQAGALSWLSQPHQTSATQLRHDSGGWQLLWDTIPSRPNGSGFPVFGERHVLLDTHVIPHHESWGSHNEHGLILLLNTKMAISARMEIKGKLVTRDLTQEHSQGSQTTVKPSKCTSVQSIKKEA